MFNLGCHHFNGSCGLSLDVKKALELWQQAGELGSANANYNIAYAYKIGNGLERNMKKAKHYWELAAVGGDVVSRYNLGMLEASIGSLDRAMKHFMISAGAGYDESLKAIQEGFVCGHVTKDDFERALRAHTEAKDEMRSDQRDAAAARIYMREAS